jgi:hypothetical protein
MTRARSGSRNAHASLRAPWISCPVNVDGTYTESKLHANSAYEMRHASSFWHDAIRSSESQPPNWHLRGGNSGLQQLGRQPLPGLYRIENGFGRPYESNAFIIKGLPHFAGRETRRRRKGGVGQQPGTQRRRDADRRAHVTRTGPGQKKESIPRDASGALFQATQLRRRDVAADLVPGFARNQRRLLVAADVP